MTQARYALTLIARDRRSGMRPRPRRHPDAPGHRVGIRCSLPTTALAWRTPSIGRRETVRSRRSCWCTARDASLAPITPCSRRQFAAHGWAGAALRQAWRWRVAGRVFGRRRDQQRQRAAAAGSRRRGRVSTAPRPIRRSTPGVVGFAGASQAGWIIPLALAASPAANVGVILSGPTVSVGSEIYYSDLAEETTLPLADAYARFASFHGSSGIRSRCRPFRRCAPRFSGSTATRTEASRRGHV